MRQGSLKSPPRRALVRLLARVVKAKLNGVSHVVNYNLPEDPEDYVHRIGRTGRAGATGISISFASEDDAFLLPDIETLLGERLKCVSPPADLLD